MDNAEDVGGSAAGLPKTFRAFVTKFPAVAHAHEAMAEAVEKAGPLDGKTRELIKIGISLGAGLESSTKSHVRRALEQGAAVAEIEQAILLGMTTCGFPPTVAAWQWASQQIQRDRGA
jgi:4-carboxymuconolactone decarboxylase